MQQVRKVSIPNVDCWHKNMNQKFLFRLFYLKLGLIYTYNKLSVILITKEKQYYTRILNRTENCI